MQQRIRFTCQYPKLKLIDGLDAVRAQLELFRTLVRQNALSPNDPVLVENLGRSIAFISDLIDTATYCPAIDILQPPAGPSPRPGNPPGRVE